MTLLAENPCQGDSVSMIKIDELVVDASTRLHGQNAEHV